MGRNLIRAIAPLVLGVSLMTMGCGGQNTKESEPEPEYINLIGRIYEGDERYMPATNEQDSRYSFAMWTSKTIGKGLNQKTEFIKHAIQVLPTKNISLESIDALINAGTTVEIKDVSRDDADKQFLTVSADRIKVPHK